MTRTCTQEAPGDKHATESRETKKVNLRGKKRKCFLAFHSFPESNNKHKEGEREQDPADAVHNDHLANIDEFWRD